MSENTPDTPKEKDCTKRNLLILNIVTLAALALLYVIFFTSKPAENADKAASFDKASASGMRIAFINNDSLTKHYELVKIAKDELESQRVKYEGEIAGRKKELEEQYRILQGNIESKRYPEAQLRSAQQLLMEREQALYDLSQDYTERLATNEMGKNEVYIDSVLNFLERLNKDYQFDYILNYSGANILLANDTFDITPMVIKGLNEEWFKVYPPEK